jgi:hypothetical protein
VVVVVGLALTDMLAVVVVVGGVRVQTNSVIVVCIWMMFVAIFGICLNLCSFNIEFNNCMHF